MQPSEQNPDNRQSAENGVANRVFVPGSLAVHAVKPVNEPHDESYQCHIQYNYDTTKAGRNPSQDANAQQGGNRRQSYQPKTRHEATILAVRLSRSRWRNGPRPDKAAVWRYRPLSAAAQHTIPTSGQGGTGGYTGSSFRPEQTSCRIVLSHKTNMPSV